MGGKIIWSLFSVTRTQFRMAKKWRNLRFLANFFKKFALFDTQKMWKPKAQRCFGKTS